MEQAKRIAIYGGTFDPIHIGHLEIGRRVTQLFGIDEFLFVLARIAPHKLERDVLPALHRYAMLALATRADAQLSISTFEVDAPGRQFTVDTLTYFRSRFGDSADLFFVMGADSWSEITTWREWRRLLTLAHTIVVTRPGCEISAAAATQVGADFVDCRGSTMIASASEPGSRKVFVTDVVMLDVSATEIRRAAEANDWQKLTNLVPPEVAEYIRKYRLYGNTTDV
jgi:nicotinate-nucleotide adenylyltransferase